MGNESTTKEARIYNVGETASSVNDVGKIGQLHAIESNWTTFSHHIKTNSKWIEDIKCKS